MGNQQGRGTIALLMVVAVAIVVALLGVLRWEQHEAALPQRAAAANPPVEPVQPQGSTGSQVAAGPQGQAAAGSQGQAPVGQQAAVAPNAVATPSAPAAPSPAERPASPPSAPAQAARPAPADVIAPSFDVVRIEPNGDSVIAGRGAPGATIELLRDGQVHSRVAADASGLFAFVPPALPAGSHQVTLQSIAPDGTRQRSRDSVSIVINENRKTQPLVALTAPDRPTVVLSSPEPPESKVAEAPPSPAPPARQQQANAAPAATPPAQTSPAPPAATSRAEVKIVTVEAEDGGRLYVSGQAAPGATVRLYLNETFIAPGGVGGDGNVSFAIGRGVKPGDYRVRLDEVDPVSGTVKSRAEVGFNVPLPVVVPSPPAVQPPVTNPPQAVTASGSDKTVAPSAQPTEQRPAASGESAAPRPSNAQVASALPEARDLSPGTIMIPDINTTIISRGDNLWRLSQRTYGHGLRYTVIYGANRGQIRNPNLIYPGQVFVLPPEAQAQAN